MKHKRYCQQCSALIPKKSESWARYKKKKYCSNSCQTKSLKISRTESECIVCGNKFKYRAGHRAGKFCSRECYYIYQKKGKKTKCDWCGKNIYVKRCYLREHKNHFCSPECQLKWQRRHKDRIECKICGKIFYASRSQNRIVCSNRCNGVLVCKLQAENKGLNNLEKAGQKLLQEINVDFKEQVLIEKKFLVDVFIPEQNIVIQWDGEYWHNKLKRKALDKSQNAYMTKCGYKVLRFWEHQVHNQPTKVKEEIRATISNQGQE